jgi:hypothetical protein
MKGKGIVCATKVKGALEPSKKENSRDVRVRCFATVFEAMTRKDVERGVLDSHC